MEVILKFLFAAQKALSRKEIWKDSYQKVLATGFEKVIEEEQCSSSWGTSGEASFSSRLIFLLPEFSTLPRKFVENEKSFCCFTSSLSSIPFIWRAYLSESQN